MIRVALYQPQIPQNCGNIIRTCAAAGVELHLIHPPAFSLTDASCRRAGLDYHEQVSLYHHPDIEIFMQLYQEETVILSSKGSRRYDLYDYRADSFLLFGNETAGLPDSIIEKFDQSRKLRLPMQPGCRCLNLSNAVAITLYEALRQRDFPDLC